MAGRDDPLKKVGRTLATSAVGSHTGEDAWLARAFLLFLPFFFFAGAAASGPPSGTHSNCARMRS